ncbi:MAG TPA: DNA polymerase Y family protein [Terracidiphilus sp.]
MTGTSYPLFAAIHAAEFPAQAILRLRPDFQSKPVAVLEFTASKESVCSLNMHARKRGIAAGMTRLEVEEVGGIQILCRSLTTEHAARTVLLECASKFSPRIEESFAIKACAFVLDISGTERLFGPAMQLAKSLDANIAAAGFRASVCTSSNFDTARMKAESARGITVIPSGKEAASIADISISSLRLDDEHNETLTLWGIRTLGELAELREEDLVTRLGQPSAGWLKLSRGTADHTFQPHEATFELKEHIEFEDHVEQLDSLLFIGAGMINNLVARADGRALCLASLTIVMTLEGSITYKRLIRPAIPSNDRRFLLKLLQLEIGAHPPQAAVVSLTLIAEAGQQSKVQLGLFTPQAPEPSRLDVTLARVQALVGADRVGSPVLVDTNRRGSFNLVDFAIHDQSATHYGTNPRISLRRMRPPHPLRMQFQSQMPTSFRDGSDVYEVHVAYGPWHSSGCWWSVNQWDLEEWDVMATNQYGESLGCLLVHDHLNHRWLLDAMYD